MCTFSLKILNNSFLYIHKTLPVRFFFNVSFNTRLIQLYEYKPLIIIGLSESQISNFIFLIELFL